MIKNEANYSPWLKFVKFILNALGLKHVWNNQYTFNINKLSNVIQVKVKEEYIRFWRKRKSETQSKLSFYNKITKEYRTEPYLTHPSINFNQKRMLCKLRTSNHDLKIEKGRHLNIPREKRLCLQCNEIEDEIHFLDTCKKYKEIRENFIKNIWKKNITKVMLHLANY